MQYRVTMIVDIEEVRAKTKQKKATSPRDPEEENPIQAPAINQLACGIPEAAAALGVSRSSIYILINDGQLPTVKIGKRTVIRVQDLHALLERTRTK